MSFVNMSCFSVVWGPVPHSGGCLGVGLFSSVLRQLHRSMLSHSHRSMVRLVQRNKCIGTQGSLACLLWGSHGSRTDVSVPHSWQPVRCRHTDVPWKGSYKSAVLSARTDVCALDGSGVHTDYPEQGGTSVGTRARGLSSCALLYCLNMC